MPRWKFGYVRQLPSGRWQPGHHGPDGHRHTGSATLANAIDAERWLVTTQRLPTWEGAFDNRGEPAHVSRPGVLVDIKGLLSVACHEHGTALSGFLPGSWDHLGCQLWDHPARLVGGCLVGSLTRHVRFVDVEVIQHGIQGGQCG